MRKCLAAAIVIPLAGFAPAIAHAASAGVLVRLGEAVFYDAGLSEPAGQSCASCHMPQRAFSGDSGSSIPGIPAGAIPARHGTRKAPSLMYKAYTPPFYIMNEPNEKGETELSPAGGFFHDGRAGSLSEQASGPMLNPLEMNNRDAAMITEKVKAAPYAALMTEAFGPGAFSDPKTALAHVTDALAAFESTAAFAPFSSKFDDVLRGTATFTPQEAKGFALFKDKQKGNCISCHAGNEDSSDPADWMMTDYTYDNLGVPRNMAIPANSDPAYFDLGLCKRPGLAAVLPASITLDSQCGAFKVPTLRNVAVTAPYFHNAAIATLRDAVKFYVTRDTNPELWYPKDQHGAVQKFNDLPPEFGSNVNTQEVPYDRKPGEAPRLDDAEIDAVVAFLKTLTDKGMQ